MEGDDKLVKSLRLGTWTTVGELLNVFGKIPPLTLLNICNPEFGKYMSNHLLQHSDDLDFVQDVLKATGGSRELNPILNSVLAGFGRRRRYGKFKCGQLNLQFDQLRFANTKTPEDDDRKAKDIAENVTRRTASSTNLVSVCRFFQQRQGCRFGSRDCRFAHRCAICNATGQGAITCQTRVQSTTVESVEPQERRRPPNPRTRRERATATRSSTDAPS